jgi:hypothetical protein
MQLRLKTDLLLAYGLGCIEALLLARFVLRLFAARPDNLVVSGLMTITTPVVALVQGLDAGQPRFGAVLEFSTLSMCVLIPILWFIGRFLYARRRTIVSHAQETV